MFSWSTGNYPVGSNAWNSTPLQVDPAYRYLTPGQAPAAQEFNWLIAQMAAASTAGVTTSGADWKTLLPLNGAGGLSGYIDFTGGGFDTTNHQWLVAVLGNTGFATVMASQGFGDNDFANVSSANYATASKITSACFDGSNYFATAINTSGSALQIIKASTGGAWSAVLTDSSATFLDATIEFFAGDIVVNAINSGASGMISYLATIGGGGGGSWTSAAGPAQTGTAIYSATNGAIAVSFPGAASPTSYMTSVAPATWTTRSASFVTGTPRGLCWSPADALFFLVTNSGTTTYIYSAPDGITWSANTTSFSEVATYGLAANNAGCLVRLPNTGSGYRASYSVDGGATWHLSTNLLPTGLSTTLPKVYASPTGFFAMANLGARFSHNSGLS